MSVSENLSKVRRDLDEASGSEHVSIVAVTKLQPVELIREAVAAGVGILAVNYAQEGEKLKAVLGEFTGEWHFIGHVQSRKVKFLPQYDCVQSLDRLSVAEDLNAILEREGKSISVLVEVNIGEEAQKSGVMPDGLEEFLAALGRLERLRVEGLMAMPPFLEPVERRQPFFERMRALFERYEKPLSLKVLSMGTSEDFRLAVKAGSNMVRLGTALFGSRQYLK